jgi:Zn-finger nucleic acid-binding protein
MQRLCPVCEGIALRPVAAGEVTVDVCPSCGGFWFDAGELEQFPDRPSVQRFLGAARHAPGRCRKKGHPVPRASTRCPRCDAPPAVCPACASRLATVLTSACPIEVCLGCHGAWLDAHEMELLAGATLPAREGAERRPPGALRGWEVPTAAPPAADLWKAPGHTVQAALQQGFHHHAPFSCTHCGVSMDAASAFVVDGDFFCSGCRPEGAVSGHTLPVVPLKAAREEELSARFGMRPLASQGQHWAVELIHRLRRALFA